MTHLKPTTETQQALLDAITDAELACNAAGRVIPVNELTLLRLIAAAETLYQLFTENIHGKGKEENDAQGIAGTSGNADNSEGNGQPEP